MFALPLFGPRSFKQSRAFHIMLMTNRVVLRNQTRLLGSRQTGSLGAGRRLGNGRNGAHQQTLAEAPTARLCRELAGNGQAGLTLVE